MIDIYSQKERDINKIIEEKNAGKEIVFITGRPESYRNASMVWLSKYFSFSFDLLMREDKDQRNKVIVKNLKKGEGLLFMSLSVLPSENKLRSIFINLLKKKKIECHFVFENLVIKKEREYLKINQFFKLIKFTK